WPRSLAGPPRSQWWNGPRRTPLRVHAREPVEQHLDPPLDLRRRLLVALAALRQALKAQRLPEGDRARGEVAELPVLRAVDGDPDRRAVLRERDHRGARLRRAGPAGFLPRALDEEPNDVALARSLSHLADRDAVRLAAPDEDRAVPMQEPADRCELRHLGLGHELDVAGRQRADERDVDPVEVVDRVAEAAGARDAVAAVRPGARRNARRDAHVPAAERPGELLAGQDAASERLRISASICATTSSTSRFVVSISSASAAGCMRARS